LFDSFSKDHLEAISNHSKSQLGQDVFALSLVGPEHTGFFVEFGAADGVALSNSYLLEKTFGWTGVLCEPANTWRSQLVRNRSAHIDFRCVFSSSGLIIDFMETEEPALSTLRGFGDEDMHAESRGGSATYKVETISLLDLLKFHKAPNHIDFISVDTEGSEFEIFKAFDFSQYTFGAIVVEHNFTSTRHKVRDLLLSKGYRQVYRDLSDFDDWFVPKTNTTISG
jgi:FkbM family methyltransferase